MKEPILKGTLSETRIIFRSLKAASALAPPPGPFTALLPAIGFDDHAYAIGLAPALVQAGCTDLVVVGPQAEELVAELEKMFEGRDVSVTPGVAIEDGVDYFLVTAMPVDWALALVGDHAELASALHGKAKAMGYKPTK